MIGEELASVSLFGILGTEWRMFNPSRSCEHPALGLAMLWAGMTWPSVHLQRTRSPAMQKALVQRRPFFAKAWEAGQCAPGTVFIYIPRLLLY